MLEICLVPFSVESFTGHGFTLQNDPIGRCTVTPLTRNINLPSDADQEHDIDTWSKKCTLQYLLFVACLVYDAYRLED